MLDPLPLLRAFFPDEDITDDRRVDLYTHANLSMKQKLMLHAAFDLKRANASYDVLQPWIDGLSDSLMDQEHSSLTQLHFAICKEFGISLKKFIRIHLELLDQEFEEALEKDNNYIDTIDMCDIYSEALSLLCHPDTKRFLDDLEFIAPTIYDHIQEYREYIKEDWIHFIPS